MSSLTHRFPLVYRAGDEKDSEIPFCIGFPTVFPQWYHSGHEDNTVPVLRMAHRKWKETKQEPGTAEPGNMLGCCLNYFHFLWAILSTSTVLLSAQICFPVH